MSATDELRRLLDESGVEYMVDCGYRDIFWGFGESCAARASAIGTRGLVQMIVTGITPAQAIEATLGRGDCQECYATKQNYKRCKYSTNRGWCDDECKMTRIEDENRILHGWLECSKCGPVYPPAAKAIHDGVRFCPMCGRKVKR